ncbi:uncharacterized protein [Oscarella lobularis]|uniref:uncharacterized protein n=1 Tax=Oscarella lobularis TaxID=121494 RepID=UPI003313B0CA
MNQRGTKPISVLLPMLWMLLFCVDIMASSHGSTNVVRISLIDPFLSASDGTLPAHTKNIRLTCSTTIPFRVYKWYRDGKEILPSNRQQRWSHGKDAHLAMINITNKDLGDYSCQLDDRNSSKLRLKFRSSIQWIRRLHVNKRKIFLDEIISLKATYKLISGTEYVSVSELCRHVPSGKVYSNESVGMLTGVRNVTLTFNVTLLDDGKITIRLRTSDSFVTKSSFVLRVRKKLPTPDLKAERTTSTSVNVRILFPKELNASYDAHSGYKVKIASEEPNSVTRFLFLNSTTMEVNITGLLPCKTYVIRLHAVGEHYLSKESRRLTVETRPNPSWNLQFANYGSGLLILTLQAEGNKTSAPVCFGPSGALDWQHIKTACSRDRFSNHSVIVTDYWLTNFSSSSCPSLVRSCDLKGNITWSSACSAPTRVTESTPPNTSSSSEDKEHNGKSQSWLDVVIAVSVVVTIIVIVGVLAYVRLDNKIRKLDKKLKPSLKAVLDIVKANDQLQIHFHKLAVKVAITFPETMKGQNQPACHHARNCQERNCETIQNLLENIVNHSEMKDSQEEFITLLRDWLQELNSRKLRKDFGERSQSGISEFICKHYQDFSQCSECTAVPTM